MATDYTGPGGHRIRRRTERCDRKPSKPDTKQREWGGSAYVDERRAIEARHDDDGTERFYRKAVGSFDYSDDEPLTEYSHPSVLSAFGLDDVTLGRLDAHGCETIYDVRDSIRGDDIKHWRGMGPTAVSAIREALNRFDARTP